MPKRKRQSVETSTVENEQKKRKIVSRGRVKRIVATNKKKIAVNGDRKATTEWGYTTGGVPPKLWHTLDGDCSGTSQSPIDIKNTYSNEDLVEPFDFSDLEDSSDLKMKMENNGRTVKVHMTGYKPKLKGGGGDGYEMHEFHFHWGSHDKQGSEHTLNGQKYAMELHMVFKPESSTESPTANAFVVGTLIGVGSKSNSKYNPIINKLKSVSSPGSSKDLSPFSLIDLLPEPRKTFYRYSGSLTTPPCTEDITWSLHKDIVYLSRNQLAKFRDLQADPEIFSDGFIVDNFRPTQPLNGRKVYEVCC